MHRLDRRSFLRRSVGMGAAVGMALPTVAASRQASRPKFQVHAWKRDPRNPVLPPGPKGFDVGCCMNPFVLRRGGDYWLFYAGADARGHRRVCLATAPVGDLTAWKRHGPLFDLGG